MRTLTVKLPCDRLAHHRTVRIARSGIASCHDTTASAASAGQAAPQPRRAYHQSGPRTLNRPQARHFGQRHQQLRQRQQPSAPRPITQRRSLSQTAPSAHPTMADDPPTPSDPTTTSTTSTTATPSPIFSSNVTDPAAAQQHLARLLRPHGRWALSPSRKGLERTFQFRTFKAAWGFMDAVAAECKRARHHPEWANVYNRVHVRWTTHRPEGLSLKDLDMAGVCDSKGSEFEEEVAEAGEGQGAGPGVVEDGGGEGDALRDLSHHIGKDACDVCAR